MAQARNSGPATAYFWNSFPLEQSLISSKISRIFGIFLPSSDNFIDTQNQTVREDMILDEMTRDCIRLYKIVRECNRLESPHHAVVLVQHERSVNVIRQCEQACWSPNKFLGSARQRAKLTVRRRLFPCDKSSERA